MLEHLPYIIELRFLGSPQHREFMNLVTDLRIAEHWIRDNGENRSEEPYYFAVFSVYVNSAHRSPSIDEILFYNSKGIELNEEPKM